MQKPPPQLSPAGYTAPHYTVPHPRSFAPQPSAPEPEEDPLLEEIGGLIFHFDGGLFNAERLLFRLAAACPLEAPRIRIERRVMAQFAGVDFHQVDDYYRAFFMAFGEACRKAPERLRIWYCRTYLPRISGVLSRYYRLRPGTGELFTRFSTPLPKGRVKWRPRVAVYSEQHFLRDRMRALGLEADRSLYLYGAESNRAHACSPAPLLRMAREMKLPPQEILVIGDREERDGIAAQAAGMHFFHIETGVKEPPRDTNTAPYPVLLPGAPETVFRRGRWEEITALINKRMERR
jgi:phosphoglycolate phosphatase/putative hydrolase of the HAD superfamily